MKQLLYKPFVIAFLLIGIAFNTTKLQAQAGTLDVSFGDSGIVHSKTKTFFQHIAVQSNNGIIISGFNIYNAGGPYITTSRFKPNGSIDSSYGDNGSTETNLKDYDYNGSSTDVAVQENDRIVVTGYFERSTIDSLFSKSIVARFLKNGKPDSSFGNNGSVIIGDLSTYCFIYRVFIQPNGKIVCAGNGIVSKNYGDFLLIRFNANGTLDSTFGENGVCAIDFQHKPDFLSDCLLKPNGQFISVGDGSIKFQMAETGPSGHLVKGFGTNGKVTMTDNAPSFPYTLAIQNSGRILVISIDTTDKTQYLAFTSNGVKDSTFGTNGIFELPQNSLYTTSTCVQDDDKIIGAGYFNKAGNLCVYRLLPNGKLDPSFGEKGVYKLQGGPRAGANDVLLLPNKKILVCGSEDNPNGGLILRLNNDATHEPLAAEATAQ